MTTGSTPGFEGRADLLPTNRFFGFVAFEDDIVIKVHNDQSQFTINPRGCIVYGLSLQVLQSTIWEAWANVLCARPAAPRHSSHCLARMTVHLWRSVVASFFYPFSSTSIARERQRSELVNTSLWCRVFHRACVLYHRPSRDAQDQFCPS